MALALGDIITYDGSTWKNQQWLQGSLGIGTGGAPVTALEVNGNVTVSGTQRSLSISSSGDAIFQRAGTTFMRFMSDNSAVQFDIGSIRGANNANLTLFAAGTGDLLLQTDSDSDVNIGSGQLFVQGSTGNVGMGTTSPLSGLGSTGGLDNAKATAFSGVVSDTLPTTPTRNDDYAPSGSESATVLLVDPGSSAKSISGLGNGVSGRLLLICNVGSASGITLTLLNRSAFSSTHKQIICAGEGDALIRRSGCCLLWYDTSGSTHYWRTILAATP
jgi:hypothetical protein